MCSFLLLTLESLSYAEKQQVFSAEYTITKGIVYRFTSLVYIRNAKNHTKIYTVDEKKYRFVEKTLHQKFYNFITIF